MLHVVIGLKKFWATLVRQYCQFLKALLLPDSILNTVFDIQMKKVFYPFTEQPKAEYKPINEEWVIEENFLNLWGYLRRRYPNVDLEDKKFNDLIE